MVAGKVKVPVGTFRLRSGRTKSDEGLIYIRYFASGKYIERSTNIKVRESDWCKKSQRVLPSNKNHIRLNARLNTMKTQYDNQILSYKGIVTARMISQMLDGECYSKEDAASKVDFIKYCFDYNQQRYDLGKISYSTFDNARYSIRQFESYIKDVAKFDKLTIGDVTIDLINKYINWRLNVRKNSREGTNKTLTPLFKAMKYAADNELISLNIASSIGNLYLDIKDRKYSSKTKEKEVKYLTPEQLKQFINLYPTLKYDRTREFMDMFLFSVYSCGLRVSDILTLEWSHIDLEKKILKKNAIKNNCLLEIPLTEPAIEILERWKNKNRNERFVFDMLPVDFDVENPEKMKNARLSKNRSIVQSLNEIGEKMKLPFSLSFHCARHTFAVIALKNGVDLFLLSRLLGHSSIEVTQRSYARFLKEDVKSTVREKLSFKFC